MSTAAAARSAPRPVRTPTTAASLRLVPQPRPRPKRGAFVLLLVFLLVGGLLTLLALNTALAQDAFVVQNLQRQQAQLDDQEQQLQQQVAVLESPETLAVKARGLGMQPGGRPRILRLGTAAR
jgi:hypothetical protein